MGAGASVLPAECTKDDARAFAGERWNETMDQKFDAICRDGKIPKVVLQHEHSFGLAWKSETGGALPNTPTSSRRRPSRRRLLSWRWTSNK